MTEFTASSNTSLSSLNRHDMTVSGQSSIYADCTVSTHPMTGIVDNIVDMPPPLATNTAGEWVLSDTDVSNGFVKDGSSLPYVFEANESGVRKRSTKILPVCGMCGKKFVCVTTMKRHLVTHTGEKPFSCKVCGKQYTQKGNLRVHERTHRNDRPFQCNICTQKFYRKEPMQKHQWRQHGIVHLKQRPNNTSANNNNPIGSNNNNNNYNNNLASSSQAVIGTEGLLYNSMTESVMDLHQVETAAHIDDATTTLAFATEDQTAVEQQHHQYLAPHQYHPQEHHLSPTEYHVVETSLDDYHQANITESGNLLDSPVAYIVQSTEDEVQYASIEVYTEEAVATDNYQEAIILNSQDVGGLSNSIEIKHDNTLVAEAETATVVDSVVVHDHDNSMHKPVKLKMKLAQAYLREIEENRELETQHESLSGGRDSRHEKLECNLSSIRLSSTPDDSNFESHQQYLQVEQASLESIVAKLTLPNSTPMLDNQTASQQTTDYPDTLQFICKSCGSNCQVSDPYSFRCGTCNMKYTSLPTHLIAEPLQCIGCVQIFPHKPALKQHQSSGVKERPFKCCKCGFEFRQKAHLQKHQWRIHRKKYDTTDTATNKDFDQQSIAGTVIDAQATNTVEVVTTTAAAPMSNEVIQKVLTDQEASPLDLSPAKMYGTTGSITKWVQQVEVARTPIKPDVTIHKAQPANGEDMTTFKDILARPPVNQLKDQVQLQIVNQLNGGKEESLTLHLLNKQHGQQTTSQVSVSVSSQMPVYAVKSRPTAVVELQQQPKMLHAARDHENNPLLNQIIETTTDQVSINIPPSDPRSPKRARTDNIFLSPPASNSLHQPADLSIHSQQSAVTNQLRTPLAVKTSPLRLETQYSTVSPPLNLSSSTTPSPQVSPYDYRVTKSALSGHFQRLKSQDGRQGI